MHRAVAQKILLILLSLRQVAEGGYDVELLPVENDLLGVSYYYPLEEVDHN